MESEMRRIPYTDFVNEVSKTNVHHTLENMRKQSPLLTEMEKNGEIKIVGAMYNVSTGEVSFYN